MANSRKSLCPDPLQAHWSACAKTHVLPGQTLVVGLSGGLDSTALLHWLSRNIASEGVHLSAVHVHHGLSGNADEWAAHCETLCLKLGVPLSIIKVSVDRASKDGLEGAARRARHAVFAETKGDWIILGHHRDDQAETLLFNLLRGTGVRGAAAMRQRNGRLLRPWLDIGRAELEIYARLEALQWVEDESNADLRFSRNFLRLRILEPLNARFPAASRNMAAAARRFSEAQTLLDELARSDLGPDCLDFPVPLAKMALLTELRARNVLRYLFACRGIQIPSEERLREALRQLLHAAPDRHPAVSCGTAILKRRNKCIVLE